MDKGKLLTDRRNALTVGRCVAVSGGPKSAILQQQLSICQPVFLIRFYVGYSRNPTQQKKNMCVIFCLYRQQDGNNQCKSSNANSAMLL